MIPGVTRRANFEILALVILPLALTLLVPALSAEIYGQGTDSTKDPIKTFAPELRAVLPDADGYTFVEGDQPHFRGYRAGTEGNPVLVGFAFLTTELAPRVFGYKGHITIMVGMTPGGTINGVEVVYHYEPFGYFSIDDPRWIAQFENKSVLSPLKVGEDIDGVSRATITVEAATLAIRQASRRMARLFLSERER
jgi:transcriptional regulator of nitric oxide reductase